MTMKGLKPAVVAIFSFLLLAGFGVVVDCVDKIYARNEFYKAEFYGRAAIFLLLAVVLVLIWQGRKRLHELIAVAWMAVGAMLFALFFGDGFGVEAAFCGELSSLLVFGSTYGLLQVGIIRLIERRFYFAAAMCLLFSATGIAGFLQAINSHCGVIHGFLTICSR